MNLDVTIGRRYEITEGGRRGTQGTCVARIEGGFGKIWADLHLGDGEVKRVRARVLREVQSDSAG